MLTAADVEAAAREGRSLVLAAGERLTPLARDRAKELGVAIVDGGSGAAQSTRSSTTNATPAAATTSSSLVQLRAAAPTSSSASAASGAPFVLPPSGALYRRRALGPGGLGAAGLTADVGARDARLTLDVGTRDARPTFDIRARDARPTFDIGTRDARPRAVVVGAGHVGAMTALRLAQSDLFATVTMVDVVPGLAEGLALDMWHGAGLYGFSTRLVGASDLAALAGADYIVITAGKPRQPGMSRTDLTAVNAEIMRSVAQVIAQHAPQAVLVVVSNPLEEMTHLAQRFTGFPDERVLGMAGVLDSARFAALVGLTGKAAPQQVRALALGSHGPEMVIPLSQAIAGDKPIEQLLDARTLAAIVERTRDSGAEVVKLLQTGSAYFSPAESAATMVRAMVKGDADVLAACVRSRGAYGTTDTRVGLPVRLGPRGLKEIVTLALRADEAQALKDAAARIAARIAELAVAA